MEASRTGSREQDAHRLHRRGVLMFGGALALVGGGSQARPRAGSTGPRIDLEGISPPDSEAQRLRDLVSANHILGNQGVNDGFGHVSARSFRNPNHYYLSRSRAPELVSASDILEYDGESNAVRPTDAKMYEERYIHGEIYKRRPDVMCVIHSHTDAILPFGLTGKPLRRVMHMAAFLPREAPQFEIRDVEGPDNHILVTSPKTGAALAAKLADAPLVVMRGHGMTVVGKNIRQAVYRAIYIKKAAEIQLQTTQLGGDAVYLSDQEAANFNAKLDRMGDSDFQPLRPWPLWEAQAEASIRSMFGKLP